MAIIYLLVGVAFLGLAALLYFVRGRVRWAAVLTAPYWFEFAWWEALPSEGGSIRLDLLVLVPPLFVITVVGLYFTLRDNSHFDSPIVVAILAIPSIAIAFWMLSLWWRILNR
jgi:hypothetical protein